MCVGISEEQWQRYQDRLAESERQRQQQMRERLYAKTIVEELIESAQQTAPAELVPA